MSRDSLGPFEGVVGDVAAEAGVSESRLRSLLREQQELVRSVRGVDGMVFEYRKAFADDPVVGRDAGAYYLRVPAHVWPEYGDLLDCSAEELDALRAVHERTLRDAVDDPDDRAALVLTRD